MSTTDWVFAIMTAMAGSYLLGSLVTWALAERSKERREHRPERSPALRDGWEAARSKTLYGSKAENPYDVNNSCHSHNQWHSGFTAFGSSVRNLEI